MKKSGFTLIELLAVIVILGIIITLAVPKMVQIANNKKQDLYESNISELERLAASYVADNPSILQNDNFLISIDALCASNYIECPIIDPRDNSEIIGNISVSKIDNKYVYSYSTSFVTIELTVDTNGGIININPSGSHNQDEIITLEPPTKDDYAFTGWKVIQGNSIISGNSLMIGTQNTTIKAQWIKNLN